MTSAGGLEKTVTVPVVPVAAHSISKIVVPKGCCFVEIYVQAPQTTLPKLVVDLADEIYSHRVGNDFTIDFGFDAARFEEARRVLKKHPEVLQSVMFSSTLPEPFLKIIEAYVFNGATKVKTDVFEYARFLRYHKL